jgi:peptidoglycan/xylan/chitin deacetylase (PgdA/CDA1 family)
MVTVDDFRSQMHQLRGRYKVVPLEELATRIRAGEPGERLAAVTFDDGWKTTRTLAAPILAEMGIPSTVFVATGLVGTPVRGLWTHQVWMALTAAPLPRVRVADLDLLADTAEKRQDAIKQVTSRLKRMMAPEREAALADLFRRHPVPPLPEDLGFMSWEEVRELPALGMTVGAHTVSHEILSRLPPAEALDQVRRSKATVEQATGLPCRLFAYPNGAAEDFSDEHARLLADEGFVAAVTQIPGRNATGSDCFRLKRFNVGLEHSLDSFNAELDGLRYWT